MAEWNERQVGLLLKMRREGKSASRIAEALGDGITRSAVIGKLARLGVEAPSKRGLGTGRTKGNSTLVRQMRQARASALVAAAPPAVKSAPVTRKGEAAAFDAARLAEAMPLAALAGDQCRFAVSGDDAGPAEHLFCGLPVASVDTGLFDPRRRYCRHHVDRVIAREGAGR